MEDSETCLVVDFGSRFVKAGFGGDDSPRAVFPTIIGVHCKNSIPVMVGIDRKKFFVGDEAESKKGLLDISYPFPLNEEMENLDDIEKIVYHMFYNELRVEPSEHPVFLVSSPMKEENSTIFHTEKFTEIMFEKFNVKKYFHHTVPSLLGLMASGKGPLGWSGISVDIGDTQTHVICLSKGKYIPSSLRVSKIGGRIITEQLIQMLKKDGEFSSSSSSSGRSGVTNDFTKYSWQKEIIRELKEKHAFFAKDFVSESNYLSSGEENELKYDLVDGQQILVSHNKLFMAPEVIFKPQIANLYNDLGVAELIHESMQQCPFDSNKEELLKNLYVFGGSSMLKGFSERLKKELNSVGGTSYPDINITAAPERKYSTWIGGSIMSSLQLFKERFCEKKMYDENGASNVVRTYFQNNHEKMFVTC